MVDSCINAEVRRELKRDKPLTYMGKKGALRRMLLVSTIRLRPFVTQNPFLLQRSHLQLSPCPYHRWPDHQLLPIRKDPEEEKGFLVHVNDH